MVTRYLRWRRLPVLLLACGWSACGPTPRPPARGPTAAIEVAPETELREGLPERPAQTSWEVAGIPLPSSELPEGDGLWAEVGPLLAEDAPYAPVARAGATRTDQANQVWLLVRREVLVRQMKALEAPGSLTPARRTETRVAAALLGYHTMLGELQRPFPHDGADDEAIETMMLRFTSTSLEQIDTLYAGCESDPDATVEWRLFCGERRRALLQQFGPGLQMTSAQLAHIRDRARRRYLGDPPPGPSECWESAVASADREERMREALQTMLARSFAGTTGDHPLRGRLALFLSPLLTRSSTPLTEREREAVAARVVRRVRSLVGIGARSLRATEREVRHWRAQAPCRAQASALDATKQAFAEDPVGELHLECTAADQCEVELLTWRPTAENGAISRRFSAHVDDPLNVASWLAAVEAMSEVTSEPNGMMLTAAVRQGTSIESMALGPEGPLPDLDELEQRLADCRGRDSSTVGALYVVDASGAATVELRADADDNECAAAVLRTVSFEPLPSGEERRLVISAPLSAAQDPRAAAYGYRVGGARVRVLGAGADFESAVVRCQAEHGADETAVGLEARITFGEGGVPSEIGHTELGDPSEGYVRCVTEALKAVVGSCEEEARQVLVCSGPVAR